MKKYYVLGIIVLIVIVGFVVLNNNNLLTKTNGSFTVYEEDGYYISKYGKISRVHWDNMNHENSGFEDVEDFLLDVDYYVDAISKYINRPNWKDVYKERHGEDFEFKINFKFTSEGPSHVKGSYNSYIYLIPEINLNPLFKNNLAPIAHEITHLMTQHYSSLSLREGLASIVQDTIGKNPSVFNNGEPVIPLSKEFVTEDNIEDNEKIIETIGTVGIPKNIDIIKDIKTRKMFYILSYSFSKYLVDEYGIEKFMEVYESEDLYTKYEEVYGKNLEELKSHWINYVRNYKEN